MHPHSCSSASPFSVIAHCGADALLVVGVGLAPQVADADVGGRAVVFEFTFLIARLAEATVAKEETVETVAPRQP